jgi:hypothetical protein
MTQSLSTHGTGKNLQHYIIRQMVRNILEHPDEHEWTMQGLGMLRTYVNKELRMHVWHNNYATVTPETGSAHHTHPWDFSAYIVTGQMDNVRFRAPLDQDSILDIEEYDRVLIQCGPTGCIDGKPERVLLTRMQPERYTPGDSYMQLKDEVHFSKPLDGTVTLIHRKFYPDTERAYVLGPVGKVYINAGARPATPIEVHAITTAALLRMKAEDYA